MKLGWEFHIQGEDETGVVFEASISAFDIIQGNSQNIFRHEYPSWLGKVISELANTRVWDLAVATASIVKIHLSVDWLVGGDLPSSVYYAMQELLQHLQQAKELHIAGFPPPLYTLLVQHLHTDDNEIRYPLPWATTIKLVGSAFLPHVEIVEDRDRLWDYLLYRQSNTFLHSIEKVVVLNDGLLKANILQVMQNFQPTLIHLLNPATSALHCTVTCEEGTEDDGQWVWDREERMDHRQ
ncbi:hypothetical protein H1R20_g5538, partial [Candolleomyces eurysporus]